MRDAKANRARVTNGFGVTIHVAAIATAAPTFARGNARVSRHFSRILPARVFPPRYATATLASARPVTRGDVPYVSMNSAPLKTSVPAHADITRNSPNTQLPAP